jgi:RNA polymerase sigma factor (sigma-70 family)
VTRRDPPRGLEQLTDEELVEQCRRANGYAWGVLVDRYKALVYSIPLKFRIPSEDAADLFQNVWLDLYSELERLREPAAVRGWLMAATTHKCLHWKSREARRAGVALGREVGQELVDARPLASEIGMEVEREQLVRDAIESIPERCRKMLKMLFFEQPPRPYIEVARELGLKEGSIGFIRGRCLEKLKKALEKYGLGG